MHANYRYWRDDTERLGTYRAPKASFAFQKFTDAITALREAFVCDAIGNRCRGIVAFVPARGRRNRSRQAISDWRISDFRNNGGGGEKSMRLREEGGNRRYVTDEGTGVENDGVDWFRDFGWFRHSFYKRLSFGLRLLMDNQMVRMQWPVELRGVDLCVKLIILVSSTDLPASISVLLIGLIRTS